HHLTGHVVLEQDAPSTARFDDLECGHALAPTQNRVQPKHREWTHRSRSRRYAIVVAIALAAARSPAARRRRLARPQPCLIPKWSAASCTPGRVCWRSLIGWNGAGGGGGGGAGRVGDAGGVGGPRSMSSWPGRPCGRSGLGLPTSAWAAAIVKSAVAAD